MGKPVQNNIPIFSQLRPQIEAFIEKELKRGIILIDTTYIQKTIRIFNSKNKSVLLDVITNFMNSLNGNYIRKKDIIARNQPGGNKYYLFLSPAREKDRFRTEDFKNITYRIYSLLFNILNKNALRLMEGKKRIKFGYSIGFHSPAVKKQDLLNRLLDMAQDMTEYWSIKNDLKNQNILYQIIKKNIIIIKHQPILNLNTNQVMGKDFIQDTNLHKHLLASVFLKRGRSYIKLGEYDKAILELSKGLEVEDENIELLYYRSYAYFKDNCSAVALQELKKVLELDPAHEDAISLKTEIEKIINYNIKK